MNRSITLSGREYPLRFSVNALCCLEEKTGQSLDALQGAQLSCVRGLLWCGLMEGMPHLTLEDTGEMMDAHLQSGGNLKSLAEELALALSDACFFQAPGAKNREGSR